MKEENEYILSLLLTLIIKAVHLNNVIQLFPVTFVVLLLSIKIRQSDVIFKQMNLCFWFIYTPEKFSLVIWHELWDSPPPHLLKLTKIIIGTSS